MDNDSKAKRLAAFGRREHALMQQLLKVQAERCALLTETAQDPATGLSAETVPTVIEPKDEGTPP
jgi:hypothetical protein